jgi:hypothetical protein
MKMLEQVSNMMAVEEVQQELMIKMNIQDYFREHQMIRMTTILSIIIIGFISAIFGLSMLMQVHGQLTPEQLENQADRQNSLRQQYWDYFVSHNITTYENIKEINDVDVFYLEQQVKQHIEDCRTGKHDRDVQTMEEYGDRYPNEDPDHGGELYYYFGETRDGFRVITFRGDLGDF